MNYFVRLSPCFEIYQKWFPHIISKGPGICATPVNRYLSTCQKLHSSKEFATKSFGSIGGFPMDFNNSTKAKRTKTSIFLQQNFASATDHITLSKEETRDFINTFHRVVWDLAEITREQNPTECSEWFSRVLRYNLPTGKLTRALFTVVAYKALNKADTLSQDQLRLAYILGWCVEMLNALVLVLDDTMDNGINRRGNVCWQRQENVGLMAISDSFMMENGMYALLRKYFKHTSCYVELLELLRESSLITGSGQALDMLSEKSSVSKFTIELFDAIARNKTSFFTFYLPFAVGAHLAGVKDPEVFSQPKAVLFEIGNLFQVQNDFLDCFGDQEIKVGTDIRDNKCSWLAIVCMERANGVQKQIMLECYGKKDPEKIAKIKELYISMDLPKYYNDYEVDTYNRIKTQIDQMSCGVPRGIFLQLLDKINKRKS